MIILQLLIAHLLGDFVFQSNSLLKKKYESWKGTFEHVLIITAFTILALFPYWQTSWAWITVGVILVTHFLQDMIKVEYDKNYNKKKSVIPFFLDQFFHIGLICILGSQFDNLTPATLPSWVEQVYFSGPLNVLIASIILLTYTYDITLYQFERHNAKKAKAFHPHYKGMMGRVIAFSLLYLGAFVLFGMDLFS